MRIAHLSSMVRAVPPEHVGGISNAMAQLAFAQAAYQGHDVTIYACEDSQLLAFGQERAQANGLQVQRRDDRIEITNADGKVGSLRLRCPPGIVSEKSFYKARPAAHKAAFELMMQDDAQARYDIIHNHDTQTSIPLLGEANLFDRAITTLHGPPEEYLSHHYAQYPFPLITLNHYIEDRTRKLQVGGHTPDVVGTALHGIDPTIYRGTTEHADYLVWIGRLSPNKGLERAIATARALDKPLLIASDPNNREKYRDYFDGTISKLINHTDTQLVEGFKGKNPEEINAQLADLRSELGGDTPIVFTGPANFAKKQLLFGNGLATLFPIAFEEPFGLVQIESMACGTPVIGCEEFGGKKNGSVSEVIDEGKTGFKIKAADSEDFIRQAKQAVDKAQTMDRTVVRKVFEERWNSRRMAQDVQKIYDQFLARGRPSAEIPAADIAHAGVVDAAQTDIAR